MPDKVGQQIGNYRLERLLGSGGFAEVYLGQHVHIHTSAAIKFLKTHLSSQQHQEGFLREAEIIARLRHLHIIRLLDFGIDQEDNTPYLIMEFAPNGTLRDRHPRGSIIPLSTVAEYVKQIAKALQYAHDQKLIHRDLKPENILLGMHQEILLGDFGVATTVHGFQSVKTGKLYAGTPVYSAPEQLQGNPSPASDQYSLGVMVYEWLSGHLPLTGRTHMELARKHLEEAPQPLAERMPELPPAVGNVVMRALTKNPEQRFDSVQEFAIRFEQAYLASSREVTVVKSIPTLLSSIPPIPPIASGNQPGQNPPPSTTTSEEKMNVWHIETGQAPIFARIWTPSFSIVFGILLVLTIGGSILTLNAISFDHVVEFGLLLLLLGVIIFGSTQVRGPIPRGTLILTGLAVLLFGFAFAVQTLYDLQLSQITLPPANLFRSIGLVAASLLSLLWLARSNSLADRIILLIVFGIAIAFALVQYPFIEFANPATRLIKDILLQVALIVLLLGVLVAIQMERVRAKAASGT